MVLDHNEAATLRTLVGTFELDAPGIDVLGGRAPRSGWMAPARSPIGLRRRVPQAAHVLHRPGKNGLGNAYRVSFASAFEHGYAAIAQLDADLSHPPAILPQMIEALERGADLVLGSRHALGGGSDGWPLHRRLASRLGCALSARALGLPYSDVSGGLKLWRSPALVAIDVASTRSQGYVFQVETTQRAHRAGLRVVELPFTFRDRTAGQSKMRASIAFEGVRMVARLRRDGWQPQRVASAARTAA